MEEIIDAWLWARIYSLVFVLSEVGEVVGAFTVGVGFLCLMFKTTKVLKIGIIVYLISAALPLVIESLGGLSQ